MPASVPNRGAAAETDAELFASFDQQLRQIVQGHVPDASLAAIEDATAYAWAELVRTSPDRYALRGWLVTVACREAVRQVAAARDCLSLDLRHELVPGDHWAPLVDRLAADSDEPRLHARDALDRIARLSVERQRKVFVLHVAGFSYDEIAERLDLTPQAVGQLVTRARGAVRRDVSRWRADDVAPGVPARRGHRERTGG